MNKVKVMRNKNYNSFLNSIKGDLGIDDSTFNIWKTELQKELPSFWDSIFKF